MKGEGAQCHQREDMKSGDGAGTGALDAKASLACASALGEVASQLVPPALKSCGVGSSRTSSTRIAAPMIWAVRTINRQRRRDQDSSNGLLRSTSSLLPQSAVPCEAGGAASSCALTKSRPPPLAEPPR